VAQLEVALLRLGLDPGIVDDSYDGHTAAAVRALYQRAGYDPPLAATETQQRVVAADADVAAAHQAVSQSESALATAAPEVGPANGLPGCRRQRTLTDAQASGDASAVTGS
jgi:hypothetical protein